MKSYQNNVFTFDSLLKNTEKVIMLPESIENHEQKNPDTAGKNMSKNLDSGSSSAV